jgi:hypothetical protein
MKVKFTLITTTFSRHIYMPHSSEPNTFLAASRGSTSAHRSSSLRSSSISHTGDGSRGGRDARPEDAVGGLSRPHCGLWFALPLTPRCAGAESSTDAALEPDAADPAASGIFSPADADTTASSVRHETCEPTENTALVARFRNGLSKASLMRRTFTGPNPGKVCRRSEGARAISAKL